MSRIIYKPTCSNCGEVIHGRVTIKPTFELGELSYDISPCFCNNCQTFFESAVVPILSHEGIDANMDETERCST